MKSWVLELDGVDTRVVLEKHTLDVWVNGQKVETTGEFAEEGTETHFAIGRHPFFIRAVSSGVRREGIVHTLHIDRGGNIMEIPEANDY